jgi:hypothetical protein
LSRGQRCGALPLHQVTQRQFIKFADPTRRSGHNNLLHVLHRRLHVIKRHPDTERTTIIGDDCILDVLGGLKRAGRSLGRLGDILVLGSRLDAEPLGPDDCLSELKAFSIALVYAYM